MKWLGIITALVVVIATTVFHNSNKAYMHRYKLTVSVDENGVEGIGSSVIEVSWIQQSQNLPIAVPQFIANVRGDATVITLSNGRALVALLGPAGIGEQKLGPEFRVWAASGLPDSASSIPEIQRETGIFQLEGKNVPDFIIFDDVAVPESARIIQSSNDERQLAPGLRLLGVTVQITSEPVTRDIQNKLPWWSREGRPAVIAWRAWLGGATAGVAVGPETLFRKG